MGQEQPQVRTREARASNSKHIAARRRRVRTVEGTPGQRQVGKSASREGWFGKAKNKRKGKAKDQGKRTNKVKIKSDEGFQSFDQTEKPDGWRHRDFQHLEVRNLNQTSNVWKVMDRCRMLPQSTKDSRQCLNSSLTTDMAKSTGATLRGRLQPPQCSSHSLCG